MKFNFCPLPIVIIIMILISACAGQINPPEPTFTPVPSTTPTQTEIPATPTPTPGPAGLCANVLNPFLPNARWEYATTGITDPWSVEVTVTGVEQLANDVAHVRIRDVNEVWVIEDNTLCDRGALQNFPLIFTSMLLSDYMDGVLNTYHVSGVYAPSYETLVANNWSYSWDYAEMLEDEVQITQSVFPYTVYLAEDVNITVHSQVVPEREAVTVPAGTFPQAIKVIQKIILPVYVWVESSSMIGDFTLHTTQWYEPYTGLIKMQVDNAIISFVEGVNIPFTINSAVTLTEFNPGE